MRKPKTDLLPQESIESKIFFIKGKRVMFDMFQLTTEEFKNLIFHFGTSRWGGTCKMPRAFTEHGILMPSSVHRIRTK